ncbi:MAG: arylsulfatase [Planctomycetota bacterium]
MSRVRWHGCIDCRRYSCLIFAVFCFLITPQLTAQERPNVIIILADDLGFSDPGCYGGEIQTPVLNRLAENGLRFSQFYNTARCWPTRASIMSGYYPQQINRDSIPGIRQGGTRRERPDWAVLLPDRLEGAGYRSYHSGKWHIDGNPMAGGFDHSYQMADHGRFFSPQRHFLDGEMLEPVERGTDFYVTTAIAQHAIDCLKDHEAEHNGEPFLSYVCFTAPHFPLHALPADIAKYDGVYDAGWEEVRDQRWQRIQESGYVAGELSEVESDVGPPYHRPEDLKILGDDEVNRPLPWDSMTDTQQQFQIDKMKIHAAMVDRMDIEIGRIIEQLEAMNQLENTLIMFLSDNGSSAEIMVRDDGHDPEADRGSADSHLCLGPGWSTTCNTPFRRHKTWVHEGGCATPMIVHWPAGIRARGEWCHQPSHVIDIVPTVLQLCCSEDEFADSSGPELPGQTFSMWLSDPAAETVERPIWFSHGNHRAIRNGDLKLVALKDGPWELYDLKADRTEQHDLAEVHPAAVESLAAAWEMSAKQFDADADWVGSTPAGFVTEHSCILKLTAVAKLNPTAQIPVSGVEGHNFHLGAIKQEDEWQAFQAEAELPLEVDFDSQAVIFVVLDARTNKLEFRDFAVNGNEGNLKIHWSLIEPDYGDATPAVFAVVEKESLNSIVVETDDRRLGDFEF